MNSFTTNQTTTSKIILQFIILNKFLVNFLSMIELCFDKLFYTSSYAPRGLYGPISRPPLTICIFETSFLVVISLGREVVPSPKTVINLPMTSKKKTLQRKTMTAQRKITILIFFIVYLNSEQL